MYIYMCSVHVYKERLRNIRNNPCTLYKYVFSLSLYVNISTCLCVVCVFRAVGKSSLKKTLLGEPYNPMERPSSGIHADPSITRIVFKQYREWIQQQASKADTHRLNLEYIDTIIDYILNFLKQGRVSC